jgi:ankyrin repeat protein
MGTRNFKEIVKACWDNDLDRIREIVAEGFELNRLYNDKEEDARSFFGQSVLRHAVYIGEPKVVECLLDLGADIKLEEFQTMLDACRHPDLLNLLIARGAEIGKANMAGELLVSACGWHSYEDEDLIRVIDILRKSGADINYRDDLNGYTALHYTAESGNEQLADMLVNRFGAAGDLPGLRVGQSALHLALTEGGYLSVAEIIIKSRCYINAPGIGLNRPLHLALMYPRGEMQFRVVRLLLEHGAYPNATNAANMSPLAIEALSQTVYYARKRPQIDPMAIIQLLIDHRANPRAEVGINPCERLVDMMLRPQKDPFVPEVVEYFRQFA